MLPLPFCKPKSTPGGGCSRMMRSLSSRAIREVYVSIRDGRDRRRTVGWDCTTFVSGTDDVGRHTARSAGVAVEKGLGGPFRNAHGMIHHGRHSEVKRWRSYLNRRSRNLGRLSPITGLSMRCEKAEWRRSTW